tara:strand:- start:149 stop:337 length:189 start_codon:yes stop_codon:yes gene_type:complete
MLLISNYKASPVKDIGVCSSSTSNSFQNFNVIEHLYENPNLKQKQLLKKYQIYQGNQLSKDF